MAQQRKLLDFARQHMSASNIPAPPAAAGLSSAGSQPVGSSDAQQQPNTPDEVSSCVGCCGLGIVKRPWF